MSEYYQYSDIERSSCMFARFASRASCAWCGWRSIECTWHGITRCGGTHYGLRAKRVTRWTGGDACRTLCAHGSRGPAAPATPGAPPWPPASIDRKRQFHPDQKIEKSALTISRYAACVNQPESAKI